MKEKGILWFWGSYDFNGDGTAVERSGIKIGPTVFDQPLLSSKARSCTASTVFVSLLSTQKETREKGDFFYIHLLSFT